jgi:hypothetical protein
VKTNPYLKLERQISSDERGGILHRWRYGRQLLEAKAGRQRLPKGLIGDLIKSADKAGLKVSEREIQYRIRCAEAYPTEAHSRTAVRLFGSWTDLREAGFPPIEVDDLDAEEILAEGLASAPDEWEQQEIDIPGLKPVLSIKGRKVPLIKGEGGATIADVEAYRDMFAEMHESFGKTLAQIEETLRTMREGADDDDEVNAVEAWEAATGLAGDDDDEGGESE